MVKKVPASLNKPDHWLVDSWQVPVPEGDCSLHVLFKREIKNGEHIIKSVQAVLVDGSKNANGKEAYEAIEKTLKEIREQVEKEFAIDPMITGPWILQPESWLVTHWDEDHFLGALIYLEKLSSEHQDSFQKVKLVCPVLPNHYLYGAGD